MGVSAHTQKMNIQRNPNDRPPQSKRRPESGESAQAPVDVEDQPLRVRWLIVSDADVAAHVFGPSDVTTIVLSPSNLAALTVHTLAIKIGDGRVVALTVGSND